MSKELSKNGTYELDEAKIQVLTQAGVIPAGTPLPQVKLFAEVCRTKGLSPFSKEIYLLGYKDNSQQPPVMKYSIITGIDGYRKIAARTGQLAGCSNPVFDLKSDGRFKTAAEVAESGQDPISCTVTVMRLIAGHAREFTATVLFKEFNGKKQKWLTMPVQMISKVAEAFALRKGFDDELSGIGVEEEAAAYENNAIAIIPKGGTPVDIDELKDTLSQCFSVDELTALYNKNKSHSDYADLFTERKNEINEMVASGQIH